MGCVTFRSLCTISSSGPAVLELLADTAQKSFVFNYLENRKTYGKSLLGIKCVLIFSPQLLFETSFVLISIQLVTLEMRTETHVSLHVKCLLSLSDFNQNCNVFIDFSKTFNYQMP
jgi:hypothetical protein